MILDALMRGLSNLTTQDDWRWFKDQSFSSGTGRRTVAGVPVDENSAMGLSSAYRAISVVAETSSSLPFELFSGEDEDTRTKQPDHPAAKLLEQPNPLMDGMTFRENMQAQAIGRGNAYAERVWGIGSDGRWRTTSLWPIPAGRVKPKLYPDSVDKYYEVKRPDGSTVILNAEEMLHIRGKGDTLEGWSTLMLARETIGLGLGAEQHGAAQFGNGNKPSGIMKFRRRPDPQAVDQFKEKWNNDHGGPANASKVGFIWGEDVNWIETSLSNQDAQFLETRKFQVDEIARFFGVPPHMLFSLERSTHNNIEQQSIEFLAYTLAYWLRKWEIGLACALLLPDEEESGLFFEHDVKKLLRTDSKTRWEVHELARKNGVMDGNEIRREENMPPRKDASFLVFPSGTMSAATVAAGNPPPPPAKLEEQGLRQKWFLSELGRMIRKEVAAVSTFAKEPDSFLDKTESFYVKHRQVCAEVLEPILPDAAAAAERHCSASFAELLELAGETTPAKLDSIVNERLRRWPERAAALAKELFP